jgi:hypothetical protein
MRYAIARRKRAERLNPRSVPRRVNDHPAETIFASSFLDGHSSVRERTSNGISEFIPRPALAN